MLSSPYQFYSIEILKPVKPLKSIKFLNKERNITMLVGIGIWLRLWRVVKWIKTLHLDSEGFQFTTSEFKIS